MGASHSLLFSISTPFELTGHKTGENPATTRNCAPVSCSRNTRAVLRHAGKEGIPVAGTKELQAFTVLYPLIKYILYSPVRLSCTHCVLYIVHLM